MLLPFTLPILPNLYIIYLGICKSLSTLKTKPSPSPIPLSFLSTAAMALQLSLPLALVAIWAVVHAQCAHHGHAAAPTPAAPVDCSSLILNLADCLTFVQSGSTEEKPQGTCCAGLKTVLKSSPECLCEGFRNSASFGVSLNMTKAAALPAACKVQAPPIAQCGLSVAPSGAPAMSPSAAGAGAGPASSTTGAGNEQAPAPAPANTGTATALFSFSFTSLLLAHLLLFVF